MEPSFQLLAGSDAAIHDSGVMSISSTSGAEYLSLELLLMMCIVLLFDVQFVYFSKSNKNKRILQI